MPSNPDESPASPNNSSSASNRDWVLVIAKILFVFSFVVLALPVYEVFHMDENRDVDALGVPDYYYFVAAFCLIVGSAVLTGLRRLKLDPDMFSREVQSGAPSWNELQGKDGKRILYAWLMHGASLISGVLLFSLVACVICNTKPILAAVFLTFAILFPSIMRLSRKNAVRPESDTGAV